MNTHAQAFDAQHVCSIEGCQRPHYAFTWCQGHWKRWRRHGDPLGGHQRVDGPAELRFWAKVDKAGPAHPVLGPCWLWLAGTRNGYGLFEGRNAHRFAYNVVVGPIPEGLELDHICHNGSGCTGGYDCLHRRCVNPAHLEAVTREQNVRRGNAPGVARTRQQSKTHCPHGHAYKDNLVNRADGYRACRVCARERERRKRAAAK